ncbi:uncharacterized protein [Argopecten irradians]|uniref:uncharacterized protein n=1 Tax=Argopecten irradians TaxID=31199 RepID=UPI003715C9FD
MDTIYVSGIPKGLNSKATCLLIRKYIESVAQVKKVWINKEKGCGHITLFDSTSVDMVLSLDGKVNVNGCLLTLCRNRKVNPLTKPKTKENRQNDLIQSHDYTRPTKIAYETYAAYKEDVPQTDTLYQYAAPVPTRCQRKKRKPWKDTARISSIQTPKSGRVRKRHSRHRKKNQYRSQRAQCHTNIRNQKAEKENLDCRRKSGAMEINDVITHQIIDTNLDRGDHLGMKPDKDVSQPSFSQVHVYDHGTHVCDIYVDNDNIFQSINDEVSSKRKIPVSLLRLEYKGKTVNESWPLHIENGDKCSSFCEVQGRNDGRH